jgi:phosphoadenosine phosphosulfate reductase
VTVTNSFFLDNTANTASAGATDLQSGLVDVRGEGGGIFNQGALTVTTTAFSGNVANSGSATGGFVATVTGYGGAVDNGGGQLTATGLGVTDNIANAGSARTAARGLGGGIYGSGRMTVDSSLVDGNTANAGSAFAIDAQGGGIYDQSALVLTGSDVTNNTVNSGSANVLRASGGGLWVAGGTITDSRVNLNIVNSGPGIPLMYLSGGGIYDSGRLTVTDGFITFNDLNTDPTSGQGLGSFATGGGMLVAGPNAFVTLNSSAVAANFALNVATGDTNFNVRVFNLDTGYQFPETLELRERLKDRYGIEVEFVRPERTVAEYEAEHGGPLYGVRPDQCCHDRKIVPLRRAVRGYDAWVSAIRRDQTADRALAEVVQWDARFGLAKVNPPLNWTRRDVWQFIVAHDVPYNPLHDQGYPSIGCRPCTRAVAEGADERAGRWAGTGKKECGLNVISQEG